MRVKMFLALPSAVILSALTLDHAAHAALLIKIDKTTQRMAVAVDGRPLYNWPVSTGGRGYDTPSGTFKPFRKDIDHRSEEYDNAPMPYSIFFTRTGNAVHGTYEQRHLGQPVSHGCVRLSVKNAATLWNLVKREKMANTTVVVTGAIRNVAPPAAVARSAPLQLAPDVSRYDAPRYEAPRYEAPRYEAPPPPAYRRYDDDRPAFLFPFFLFDR